MAVYRKPTDLSNLPWLNVQYIPHLDAYGFRVEHRGIYINDILGALEERDLATVTKFIIGLQKAVNYYLDAIWC